MNDYAATQVLLLCRMTQRYAHQRPDHDTNIVINDRLRPVVLARFRKAQHRLNMAAPKRRVTA